VPFGLFNRVLKNEYGKLTFPDAIEGEQLSRKFQVFHAVLKSIFRIRAPDSMIIVLQFSIYLTVKQNMDVNGSQAFGFV
jgi:hypothetical protein